MSRLRMLPCLDSEELASRRRQELNIPRDLAAALGRSAVGAAHSGSYLTEAGQEVVWRDSVQAACNAKRSIAPDVTLPDKPRNPFRETRVQVSNETTLGAARRLVERGLGPLALNFANGIHPGGGFLGGARAQEEVLCRSSAHQDLTTTQRYMHLSPSAIEQAIRLLDQPAPSAQPVARGDMLETESNRGEIRRFS